MSKKTKKKDKSSPKKTPVKISEDPSNTTQYKNWRDYLIHLDVKNVDFDYETMFLVESNPSCFTTVDEFIAYTETVEQSRIRIITADSVKRITEGHTKNAGELQSTLKKAVAEAKTEIKKNNHISTELEALLVKIIILLIRNQYLSHKENYNELQKALEQEHNSLLQVESTEKAGKKGKGKKGKGKDKGKKGKKGKSSKSTSDPCLSINTVIYPAASEIRKRMKYLKQSEDFVGPEEGTDLYFAFPRMYNYDLLEELQKIGVKVTALIDVSRSSHDFITTIYHKTPFESNISMNEVRQIDVSNFWRACGIAKGNTLFKLPKETCYLRYVPKDNDELDQIYMEEATSEQEIFYSEILRIAQSLTDLKRLHRYYLDSTTVLDVEELKKPPKLWCMNTYNKILNKIPNEFQNVPVILHALLEEVLARLPEDTKQPKEKNPPSMFHLYFIRLFGK